LSARLALAFAAVGAMVTVLLGVFSYQTASERIHGELDRTLLATTTAVAAGATAVLAPNPALIGPDNDHDEAQPMIAQWIHPDGSGQRVGGRPVSLPISQDDRALTVRGKPGDYLYHDVTVGQDD